MPNSKVEIVITARDAASRVMNGLASATRQYHRTLSDLNGIAGRTANTIRNMLAGAVGVSLFKKAITSGYEFNSTIEDTRLGIAGLVYSMNEFRDAQNNVVKDARAWNAAMKIAVEIQDRLRIQGLKTPATYTQLTNAYTQAYTPGKKAKFTEKQIVNFTVAATQAVGAMRGPEGMQMLGEEVRSILAGTMTPRTTILQPLMEGAGLTNEKIKELAKSGKLYEAVMEAFKGSTIAADEATKNFSVRLSNLKDAMSQVLGRGLETGFNRTKQLIADITDKILVFDEKTSKITFNEEIISILERVDEVVFSLIDNIVSAAKAINAWRKENPVLVDLIGYLAKLVIGAIAVNAGLRAMGGMWIWMTAHGKANIGLIVNLFGDWIKVLNKVNVQTIATSGVMTKLGAAAGMAGAAFAGWQIGSWISKMQLGKKTMNEWTQDGISYFMQFLAYVKKVFSSIPEYAKYAVSSAWAWHKSFFISDKAYEQLKQKNEAALKSALAGIDASYRAEAARQKTIRSMYGEVDAGKKVIAATDKAKDATDGLTASGKKFQDDTDKKTAKIKDFTHSLERLADILDRVREKTRETAYETTKLSMSPHAGKVADVKKEYEKDLAGLNEYIKDASRIVADAQKEGISAAAAKAAGQKQKEIIEETGRLKTETEKKYLAGMSQINKDIQKEITEKTQSELDNRITAEKTWIKDMQEGIDALYAAGIIKDREYAEKKAAIAKAGGDAIQKILADHNKAVQESNIQNQLSRLDTAEKERTLSKTDLTQQRIRLNENLLSIQQEYLASINRAKDPAGWNAQQQAIIATQARLVELNDTAKELSGTFTEGLRRGLADYLYDLKTTFQHAVDIARETATAMEQSFSDFFFDAFEGKLNDLGDYITSWANAVKRTIANALGQQVTGAVTSVIQSFFTPTGNMSGVASNPSAGAFGAQVAHTGGKVLNYIPVFHKGGLNTGERLVINRVGERYITEEQNTWLTNIARTVREQGSGIGDRGTGSREQGAGSGDQGTGSREQGSGIGDRGAGNIQHLTLNRDQGSGIGEQGSGNPANDGIQNSFENFKGYLDRILSGIKKVTVNVPGRQAAGGIEHLTFNIDQGAGSGDQGTGNRDRAAGGIEHLTLNIKKMINAQCSMLNAKC